MRPAAELLVIEGHALRPILESAPDDAWDRPTVLPGWSVRDVLAHCGAALTRTATDTLIGFTPADNQIDVDERKDWPIREVLDELFAGYELAAGAIDLADGVLDGVGLGEWVHGGDIRGPLGAPNPYTSAGIELAVPLLLERSAAQEKPAVEVVIDGSPHRFGLGEPKGSVVTDVETFVRLCAGRAPDPSRYAARGVWATDLLIFS
jgi:uncharacterized protein (TIGR03083 family)